MDCQTGQAESATNPGLKESTALYIDPCRSILRPGELVIDFISHAYESPFTGLFISPYMEGQPDASQARLGGAP